MTRPTWAGRLRGFHKVAGQRIIELLKKTPDPSKVRQLASAALGALRTTQEQLRRDADELHAQRGSLDADRRRVEQAEAELGVLREELESKFIELAKMMRDLDRQRSEVEALRTQLQDGQTAVAARPQGDCRLSTGSVQSAFDNRHSTLRSHLPKPAADKPSDELRKLRRDAKRRAIGV